MPPGQADKTVSRKVLGHFGMGLAFAFAFLVFVYVILVFAVFACLAFAFAFALYPLPNIERSMGTTSPAARSACALQLANSIVLTCG